jgi:hypothetical protein
VRLCPWADVVYGCDGPWWQKSNGLPEFKGTKLAHDTGVCIAYRDVHKIEVRDHDLMLFDEPGVIGSGGNSGFQAINLAAQFGANRIMLIGFDMHGARGVHWYGSNCWRNAGNPLDHHYVHWRSALSKQSKVLRCMGIDVVNASQESALTCFRYASIEQTLADWNL